MQYFQLQLLLVVAIVSIVTDIRYQKIPNVICLAGIIGGLVFHFSTNSFSGFFALGIGGMFSAGLILLPLYAMGGMAAGDVKLMAATGCILGWPVSIEAALLSLCCGTFLGLAYCVLRGGMKEIAQRYGAAIRTFIRTGSVFLPETKENSIVRSKFPYALAISSGSLLAYQIGPGV